MERLRWLIELRFFGVCARLGEKLGMNSESIRLFFIYASFITFASPVFLYLILAFIIRLRSGIRKRRMPIWDY